ncbi:RES family NAD+ phosphorylase [Vibrio coralliilyticus]|uniref:RES domain-containing protein n=1 Tax=Vibrio coralliilyticus TaxID=190893 RepID=A0AAN0SIB8_9VIBR|nr:RES family NAD+ phosphorylase [Vibrio coralliilyticus]AIW22591.1 hypothetical protein IX92_26375 [Vibrio coralliilyticus]NOH36689.1 RES family NAD+ phosphorylase [Vibrio coralliilyticus]
MILFRTLHKTYFNTWKDYEKGSSFISGARWNKANTPVMYMSSNVQNAMLEATNYAKNPKSANRKFVMGVFDCPPLRLYEVRPEELPAQWNEYPFIPETQAIGSEKLLSDEYDGIVVPSCTINLDLVRSPVNEVRRSIYANVVLNPEKEAVREMKLLETFSPVFSNRMFL